MFQYAAEDFNSVLDNSATMIICILQSDFDPCQLERNYNPVVSSGQFTGGS
jgi:hypothetical protein